MKIMGLDIGGANTDCCIFDINDDELKLLNTSKEYLPMWNKKEELHNLLRKFKKYDVDVICVTITAELSDGFRSKKEGINYIIDIVDDLFDEKIVKYVTYDGLKDYEEIKENPLNAAAANWIGSATLIKYIKKDCIFMDMGSTTTDIIPIINKKEAASHDDTDRLCAGELVYTGMLRTNVATITHEVPINSKTATVSSELFAITADINMILGHITEDKYTCNTPDGDCKDILSSKRRLARVVCGDLDTISDENIENIAQYIHNQQIIQVSEGLLKVVNRTGLNTVIITNLSHGTICKKAAKKIGLNIIDLEDYLPKELCEITPTLGSVIMYIELIPGKKENIQKYIKKKLK